MKKMGFNVTYLEDGTAKGTLSLKEEEVCSPRPEPKSKEEPQTQTQPPKATDEESQEAEAI
jgi:hypothetical protein